jgi:hypothetical protein
MSTVRAQAAEEQVEISFFLNGKPTSFPATSLDLLSGVPVSDMDAALIHILISSGKYQNVVIETGQKHDGTYVFVISASLSMRIQHISFEGLGPLQNFDYTRFLKSKRNQIYTWI